MKGDGRWRQKKVAISVNDLKDGMVSAEDIIIEGSILVAKGLKINESIIKKLKEVYFQSTLLIYDEEVIEEENNSKKELEDVQVSVKKFSKSVQNIFKEINSHGKTDINEIRNFSNKIMDELNSPSMVIKSVVLEGSGKDSIFKHSVNVAALSLMLGKWLGLDKNKLNLLVYAAVLHDFGKTKINNEVLNKSTELTEQEFKQIKKHPIYAYNLIKDIPYLSLSVGYGVLMHHERLDGSGYPLGLKGENVDDFAKIIAIADIFDAVNSDRAYKKSTDPFRALEIIQEDSLGKIDYAYSKVFIEHIINYYIGEKVRLNNGKVCKILQIYTHNLSKPLLLDDGKFVDLKNHKDLHIEELIIY